MEKKENGLIDIVKFFMAILIVCAHYASEWGAFPTILDYSFSLYIIVVPFFFTTSGYFLYLKVKSANEKIYKDYILRILQLYLAWSLIYFICKIVSWIVQGASFYDILHYFHVSLVFTTYPTIWFLPACAIGALILYVLNKKLSLKSIGIIALGVYIVGSLGYSYSFLLKEGTVLHAIYDAYNKIFITTRNGVFNAFPWMTLGAIIASNCSKLKRHRVLYGGCTLIFLICVVAESIVIKVKFHSSGMDTIFFLIPFIFTLMMLLIKEDIPVRCGRWMRKMSTLIFVSQRIFLTAIPSIIPVSSVILTSNSYIGLLYVLISVMLVSGLILIGSKKYKILERLR